MKNSFALKDFSIIYTPKNRFNTNYNSIIYQDNNFGQSIRNIMFLKLGRYVPQTNNQLGSNQIRGWVSKFGTLCFKLRVFEIKKPSSFNFVIGTKYLCLCGRILFSFWLNISIVFEQKTFISQHSPVSIPFASSKKISHVLTPFQGFSKSSEEAFVSAMLLGQLSFRQPSLQVWK